MSRKLPTFNPSVSLEIRSLPDLGKLVRNHRARAGLRIDSTAAMSRISSDVLSRLENGNTVTVHKLMSVLEVLGLRMLVVPKEDADELKAMFQGMHAEQVVDYID